MIILWKIFILDFFCGDCEQEFSYLFYTSASGIGAVVSLVEVTIL